MNENVRAFLAIELPVTIRSALEQALTGLRNAAGRDVKWTAAHNAHLTLHFFGSESRDRLLAAAHALRAARLPPAYPAQLGALGAFPSLEDPKVVWIGLQRGHQETLRLQSAVATVLERLNFLLDARPFHPHVTLGRTRVSRSGFRSSLQRVARDQDLLTGAGFPVEAVALIESRLGGPEPVYEALDRIRLEDARRADGTGDRDAPT